MEVSQSISVENFSGSQLRPGLLELCSGSAILSFTAETMGFFSLPVDYERNKFTTHMPIIKMDLTEESTVEICIQLIRSGSIQVITAAVPCGTASRAREIPIPGGPKPLRSSEFPYGLPSLAGVDLVRVQLANLIYSNVHRILVEGHLSGCLCLEENPDKSLFWMLDEPNHL